MVHTAVDIQSHFETVPSARRRMWNMAEDIHSRLDRVEDIQSHIEAVPSTKQKTSDARHSRCESLSI